MAPLTEYELQRLKRIEENRRRMEELGVVQALQAIAASQVATQCSPAVPRAPRRPPRFVVLTEEDLRRSGRAKKEVDYNEHSLFKHAEAALRQAEARPQRIVVREWKQRGGGAGQGVRIRGWHESYGTAGHEAQERCMHEAHRLADSLANPAFMKVLTPSMVSGGFWCSAPRGLKDELGISSKCAFTAYLPEGQTVPTDACRLNAAGDGWDIVWLPHGKKGSSFGFSGNWVGFAVDNRLFPGDCLVCEVLPKEEPRGPTAFSLRFHALRAYDYEEDDGVKAACQAAWGTRAPMEEGDAIEDDAVEEAAVEEEGVEVDAVEDEVAEEEALQVDAVEEEGDSALQQAGEGQQQHKEGPPAVEAAAAVELSDREAEEREGPDGGATDAACAPAAAPPSATPKRKRQTLMTEAAASKRPRRTSGGGQASDAAAAKQQGKPKSPSTTAAGKRATKQRPAKKLAANAGRGARKQTAVRKDKRAPAAAVEAEAEAKAEAEAAPAGQEKQEEEEVSYEVECILGFKGRGAGRRVHIKWWGYKETTWEPLSMLDQALEAYPLAPGLIL